MPSSYDLRSQLSHSCRHQLVRTKGKAGSSGSSRLEETFLSLSWESRVQSGTLLIHQDQTFVLLSLLLLLPLRLFAVVGKAFRLTGSREDFALCRTDTPDLPEAQDLRMLFPSHPVTPVGGGFVCRFSWNLTSGRT